MTKLKIGFVCVHNSCRSQMAEAITNLKYNQMFDACSGGTEVKDHINQGAVLAINKLYNINMEDNQHSKLISDLPKLDILITMGCNVNCPTLPAKHREDWGLDDPSGLEDYGYELTAKIIDEKIKNLEYRIKLGEIII